MKTVLSLKYLNIFLSACLLSFLTSCNNASRLVPSNQDAQTYAVSSSGDNLTIGSSSPQLILSGATANISVAPVTGYTLSTSVGGTCPSGSWTTPGSVYTTGAITSNCSVSFSATINSYLVTPTGANVTINPNSQQSVNYSSTQAFTVAAVTGYTLSTTVGGTCPTGSWTTPGSVYTTGAITSNCSVSFSATINSYSVTSTGANVAINPNSQQSVNYNSTQAFTVAAVTGYTLSTTVGGTCPTGSWTTPGSVYTTGAITSNCSVSFNANINPYTVTSSATGVTASPATSLVPPGSTTSFNVSITYFSNWPMGISQFVSGNCPAGNWTPVNYSYPAYGLGLVVIASATYTTGAIAANCALGFSGGLTETVTISGSHVNVSPSNSQQVITSNPITFSVTAQQGYLVEKQVGGSCPVGTWSGTQYTIPANSITSNCAVSFLGGPLVTPSGANLVINPSTPQAVVIGSTAAFSVTANPGYSVGNAVQGTCPVGTWSGSTYTTGTVSSDCSVIFDAIPIYSVSASGTNVSVSPSTQQTVPSGSTSSFTVKGDPGYGVLLAVGGTCPVGTWSGQTYTTAPITGNCSVNFNGGRIVTPGGTNLTISPNGPLVVANSQPGTFTVAANPGYSISNQVGGTCPQGSWQNANSNSLSYTTGSITANCTVVFSTGPSTALLAQTPLSGNDTVQYLYTATDTAGNAYLAGMIKGSGTVDFGNGVTAAGTGDSVPGNAILLKLNSQGIAQWAAVGSDWLYNSVAVDSSGNVYVVATALPATSVTTTNAYLIKFNSSGVEQWRTAPTATYCSSSGCLSVPADPSYTSLTVDGTGNLYVGGYFIFGTSNYNFGNGVTISGTPTSAYQRALLVKYSSAGVAQWAISASSSFAIPSSLNAVVTDSNGNVFAAGGLTTTNGSSGSVSFGNSISLNAGYGYGNNAVILEYNSAGSPQWGQSVSGTSGSYYASVAVDGAGNVYVAGSLDGIDQTFSFGNGLTTSQGGALIVQYSSSGAAQWTNTGASAFQGSYSSVTVDGSGNVYAAGALPASYLSLYNFGNGVSIFGGGAILAKLNSQGTTQWAQTQTSGNLLSGTFNSLAADTNGNLYVAGTIYGTAACGFGNGVTVSGITSTSNAVLVKYRTQ